MQEHKPPKVSVVMSVYNGERYLREAIDSILCQTYTDFEFIIVDDGSQDDTPRILSGYKDKRIRVITNQSNIGLTKSLNKGIALAKAKYIARMDADDISLPTRLERQVVILDNYPEISVVSSWVIYIDKQGSQIVVRRVPPWERTRKIFHYENLIVHGAVMFRKPCFDLVGGYDESRFFGQDRYLWKKMIDKNFGFHIIQEPLYKFRLSTENISVKDKNKSRGSEKSIEVREKEYKFWIASLFLQENEPLKARSLLVPLLMKYPLSVKIMCYYLLSFPPNKLRFFLLWRVRLIFKRFITWIKP